MPRNVSLVGLARRGVFPQNNITSKCLVCDPVVLGESDLACADVAIFRGQHLTRISNEMALPRGITRELFVKFRDSLEEACMMGSLVRLDRHFQNFESGQLRLAIDAYVDKKRAEGVDESYFANEAGKGIRLLNVLERRYDVVCTNPPYMSNRNMNPAMGDFMKRTYKKSKGDLYSAFIERCAELLNHEGRLAMIAQQSFMFISSFEDLREVLLGATAIETMAHVGPRAFAEVTGEKVNTAAFALRREQLEMERRNTRGVYFRLVKEPDAESKQTGFEQALARRHAGQPDSRVYEYRQGDFAAISGSPWVYWITQGLRNLFASLPRLGQSAATKQGLATADNLLLRYWWEVGTGAVSRESANALEAQNTACTWFPYMKGGSFRRWYGNQEYCVNWAIDGAQIRCFGEEAGKVASRPQNTDSYFRRGVTYSYLTAGAFSARLSPGGFIFDVAGSSLFPTDVPLILALLNSTFAQFALKLINPTVNFQIGDLARLPVPIRSSETLHDLVNRAIALARVDSVEDETTYDFIAPPAWPDGYRTRDRTASAARSHRDGD